MATALKSCPGSFLFGLDICEGNLVGANFLFALRVTVYEHKMFLNLTNLHLLRYNPAISPLTKSASCCKYSVLKSKRMPAAS